jgi:hypothetical protein
MAQIILHKVIAEHAHKEHGAHGKHRPNDTPKRGLILIVEHTSYGTQHLPDALPHHSKEHSESNFLLHRINF